MAFIQSKEARYWLDQHTDPDIHKKMKFFAHVEQWSDPKTLRIFIDLPSYAEDVAALQECLDNFAVSHYRHFSIGFVGYHRQAKELRNLVDHAVKKLPGVQILPDGPGGYDFLAVCEDVEQTEFDYAVFLGLAVVPSPYFLDGLASQIMAFPQGQFWIWDEIVHDRTEYQKAALLKKPWDVDLFMAEDYICDAFMVHKGLLKYTQPSPNSGQAWIYDFCLQVAQDCNRALRVHCPFPLSLRYWAGQDAGCDHARLDAEWNVVTGFLGQTKSNAEVQRLENGSRKIVYHHGHWPLVSVIIPTRDRLDLMKMVCHGLLEETDYPNLEVIIVDNGSEEPETLAFFDELSRQDNIHTLRVDAAFNFADLNNKGAEIANGDVLLCLNNDIEVMEPNWLKNLVRHVLRPDVGAVGAFLFYPDGRIQHAGVVTGGPAGVADHFGKLCQPDWVGGQGLPYATQEMSAVTAACVAMRRDVFEAVNGYDIRLQVAFNDIDLCFRISDLGYRILWTPDTKLIHHESVSRGEDNDPIKKTRAENEIAFMRRVWLNIREKDGCHNPHLSWVAPGYRFDTEDGAEHPLLWDQA